MPGVTIAVRGLDITLDRTTTSESGKFSLLSLPPGHYSLTCSKPGWTSVVFPDLAVAVGTVRNLSATLKPQPLQQSVEVQETAPTIETTNSIDQTVVEGQYIA